MTRRLWPCPKEYDHIGEHFLPCYRDPYGQHWLHYEADWSQTYSCGTCESPLTDFLYTVPPLPHPIQFLCPNCVEVMDEPFPGVQASSDETARV